MLKRSPTALARSVSAAKLPLLQKKRRAEFEEFADRQRRKIRRFEKSAWAGPPSESPGSGVRQWIPDG